MTYLYGMDELVALIIQDLRITDKECTARAELKNGRLYCIEFTVEDSNTDLPSCLSEVLYKDKI